MEYIDVSLCQNCDKATKATGYDKTTKEKWRVFVCTLSGQTTGIQSIDSPNIFKAEPDEKPPDNCPFFLEHTLKKQN